MSSFMSKCAKTNKEFRSGFIALIGRPNVGKSTLLNQLVGKKISITSPVAQTTRNRLRAILTTSNAQMIFVDTPGIHKPHHLLGERLVQSARRTIGEVDLVVLIFEACHSPGKGDDFIVKLLAHQKIPVLVVLNKWDLLQIDQFHNRKDQYKIKKSPNIVENNLGWGGYIYIYLHIYIYIYIYINSR